MAAGKIELSVDELLVHSRTLTGIDIVDDEIIEPLRILHRGYCEEAQLDEEGAAAHSRNLLRHLANRLRMKRDLRRHPEILEQQLCGPLVIMGAARSGTTTLQKCLAASGDFNWLPFWMNFNWASRTGQSNEPLEERIGEADAHCRWFDRRSPDAKRGHAFETWEPEEEAVMSEGSFVTSAFLGFAELPGYMQWLAQQNPGIMFAFLRDALKYLQWQGLARADKPWLLKSPTYNGLELEILKVFPDARLIMAHRSPLKTLTSMCKLVQCFRAAYSERELDVPLLVEHNILGMNAHLANRHAHPELPLLDIRFEDIVGALPHVIERIYADAGVLLTEASLGKMLQWEAGNAVHRHGEFKYALGELGIEETMIRTKMAKYFELLDALAKENN
jgi:hypothetical protein